MKITEIPYNLLIENGDEFDRQFDDACDWLTSIGLDHNRTRYGDYKKAIDIFTNSNERGKSEEQLEHEFYSFLNAYAEIAELVRIKSVFSEHQFSNLNQKLKKVLAGSPFKNLSGNDNSRDFLFELTIASRFINAGYKVDINQSADVVASTDGIIIYIECKRVKSAKQIKKRVKSANQQLKKRIQASRTTGARGIVALHVSDIINPEYKMNLIDDPHKLKRINSDELQLFVENNEAVLKSKMTSKSLGVLCEHISNGFTISKIPPAHLYCRGAKFYTYNLTPKYKNLISEMLPKLCNQKFFNL